MNNTISWIIGGLLLTLAVAAPVSAACDGCDEARMSAEAVGIVLDDTCDLVYVHITTPAIVLNPLLGIVDFDPDDCYDVFAQHAFGWAYLHYDGRN